MGVTDEASSDTLGKRKQQMEKFSTEKKKTVFSLGMFGKIGKRERERKRNKVISLDAKPLQGLSDTINAHLSA